MRDFFVCMVKIARKHLLILVCFIVAAVFVGNIALGTFLAQQKEPQTSIEVSKEIPPTLSPQENDVGLDHISYDGVAGKDALTLLKEKAAVEQDASGLVVAIDRRKPDSSQHEFWAFYVNGQMAQVGPADYKTKAGDKIEWKIEKY